MWTEATQVERERLWQFLGAPGSLPQPVDTPVWYLALMLGAAAWFAGLLLMLVTVIVWSPNDSVDFIALALLWGLPGLALLRGSRALFAGQLGLSLLIAGECAAVIALTILLDAPEPVLLTSALLFTAVAVLAGRPAAQGLNVLSAAVAWVLWLRWSLLGEPWDIAIETRPALASALGVWLLCWGPLLALLLLIVVHEARWMATRAAGLLRSALAALIVALAFATPLTQPFDGLLTRESDGSRDWMALWPLLSLAAAGVAIAVAWQQRQRVLIGWCGAGLLLHVAHFYYALGVSLIAKSAVMLLMGVGLLGLAAVLREDRP